MPEDKPGYDPYNDDKNQTDEERAATAKEAEERNARMFARERVKKETEPALGKP